MVTFFDLVKVARYSYLSDITCTAWWLHHINVYRVYAYVYFNSLQTCKTPNTTTASSRIINCWYASSVIFADQKPWTWEGAKAMVQKRQHWLIQYRWICRTPSEWGSRVLKKTNLQWTFSYIVHHILLCPYDNFINTHFTNDCCLVKVSLCAVW